MSLIAGTESARTSEQEAARSFDKDLATISESNVDAVTVTS